ncbi:MAG: electron transport complex protein RnfG [Planctomycetota bacterium]|jgi:electron transport complex protein RnfG
MRSVITCLFACLLATAMVPAQGKVFLTTDEALALAFPKCKIERTKHVLTTKKKQRVLQLSGHKACRSMVYAYEARREGKLIGTAYFDRHRVRSKQELVMVVVSPVSLVQRIEVIAFGEPLDYLPRGNFYQQFLGRGLKDKLTTKGKVRSVVGATLTVNATVAAVRRLLATHQVVFPKQVEKTVKKAVKKAAKKVPGKTKPPITTS